MDDGIYFGLPQEEYHKLKRFSGSLAQNMLVSPATCWADSWFNPKREEKEAEKVKDWQIVGDAYHKARLEPELYQQIYVRGLDWSDYPGLLTNHEEIKTKIRELGHSVPSGEKVFAAAVRLRDEIGYTGPIKHLIEAGFEASLAEWQIVLPPKTFDEIAADMEAMHGNEELAPFLREGVSEVSILWTDAKGVQWKARIDRLQVSRITDLKTFDNSRRNVLEQCLYNAVQYNRLYIQAYVYWTACELIRAGELAIKKVQNQAQKDLIAAIRASEDPFEYWWVFQEKGGIPNVLARRLIMTEEPHPSHLYQAPDEKGRELLRKKLRSPSKIWNKARLEVGIARDLFLRCQEIWPDGPWGSMMPVSDIEDEGFNPRWLEE